MPEIVLATRNRHKIEEIADALRVPGVTFTGLDAYPEAPEVVEDGDGFEANARKKAETIRDALGRDALADDSGLCVDALGGTPGVRSARYAGECATDEANRALLLEEMGGAEDRRARFVCVLALAWADGGVTVVEGRCEGTIRTGERGDGGFGYDPLFVPEGHERTFAEMTRAEKAALSHRGRALRKLAGVLAERFPASSLGGRS